MENRGPTTLTYMEGRPTVKKSIVAVLALALIAGALSAPAVAGKKKKPKPVETTLYFHGTSALGEQDSMPVVNDVNLKMDATEPSGTEMRSKAIVNGVATPNGRCAGNNFFPLWVGEVSGRIQGDVTVSFDAVASPGQVLVRVWPDVFGLMCNSNASGSTDYPEPGGEVVVDLPAGAGLVEAVIEGVDFEAGANLMVQISPFEMDVAAGETVFPPFASRVLYDSVDYPSHITFSCLPASGKSCVP